MVWRDGVSAIGHLPFGRRFVLLGLPEFSQLGKHGGTICFLLQRSGNSIHIGFLRYAWIFLLELD